MSLIYAVHWKRKNCWRPQPGAVAIKKNPFPYIKYNKSKAGETGKHQLGVLSSQIRAQQIQPLIFSAYRPITHNHLASMSKFLRMVKFGDGDLDSQVSFDIICKHGVRDEEFLT